MQFSGDTRCTGRPGVPDPVWRGFRFCRRNSLKFVFVILSCCLGIQSKAALSTVTVSVSVPQQEDFSDQPITFQKFDASLGKLSSVEIILQGTGELTQQFENRANSRNSARVRQTLLLNLAATPDAKKPLLSAKQTEKHKYKAGPFDGVTDFGGTSGTTGVYDVTASDDEFVPIQKRSGDVHGFGSSGNVSFFQHWLSHRVRQERIVRNGCADRSGHHNHL